MVWGCITSKGVGKILRVSNKINTQEYCNTLLDGIIGTYDEKNLKPSEYLFQQDNAACHTSSGTMNWLINHNISTLAWPANYPDLNPIENVWNYLNKKIDQENVILIMPIKYGKFLKMNGIKYQKLTYKSFFSQCVQE